MPPLNQERARSLRLQTRKESSWWPIVSDRVPLTAYHPARRVWALRRFHTLRRSQEPIISPLRSGPARYYQVCNETRRFLDTSKNFKVRRARQRGCVPPSPPRPVRHLVPKGITGYCPSPFSDPRALSHLISPFLPLLSALRLWEHYRW